MRHPQLLVYESDDKLASLLRPLAEENKWLLRQPRQMATCVRLFERGGPGVLVLRPSRDLERELDQLERLTWIHPDAAVVLIVDSEQARLGRLAWDLGVRWVLPPPHNRERLSEVVTSLMRPYQATGG